MKTQWILFQTYIADEEVTTNESIEADRPVSEIRQEPYSLPKGFHWDTLDIKEPLVVGEQSRSCFERDLWSDVVFIKCI